MNTRLFRTPVPVPDERAIEETAERVDSGILWAAALVRAERACCCPAKPQVVSVMRTQGNQVELLLCRHHFLASHKALEAAGAATYNSEGAAVTAADV